MTIFGTLKKTKKKKKHRELTATKTTTTKNKHLYSNIAMPNKEK